MRVAVLEGVVKDELGRAAGLVGPHAPGFGAAVGLPNRADQGGVSLSPGRGGKSLVQLGEDGRLVFEGGREYQDAVAHGGLRAGVSTVGRLGPDEGGRGVGAPVDFARTGMNQIASDAGRGDFSSVLDPVNASPVAVEDVHFACKGVERGLVAVGAFVARGEQMAAVGRGFETRPKTGGQERFDFPVGHGDADPFGGSVVLEDGFVVGIGEQVLVGAGRLRFAGAFLYDGTGRHDRRRRGIAATGRDAANIKGAAVDVPSEGIAEQGDEVRSEEAADLAAVAVKKPQLDALAGRAREGDAGRVGRPRRGTDAEVAGQLDVTALAVLDRDKSEPQAVERTARSVGARVEAQSGEAQLGFGETGEGGQTLALDDEEFAAVRRQTQRGRRQGLDDARDGGWRQLVGGGRSPSRSGGQNEEGEEDGRTSGKLEHGAWR